MSKIRCVVTFAGLVEFVAECDEDQIFGVVKAYIRQSYDMCQQCQTDLIDCNTVDNFVQLFADYFVDSQIEFEVL